MQNTWIRKKIYLLSKNYSYLQSLFWFLKGKNKLEWETVNLLKGTQTHIKKIEKKKTV